MATIKAYTDLQQSKKLAEFLPLKSADMVYQSVEDECGDGEWESIPRNNSLNIGYDDDTPCWSLAALRNLLPTAIKPNKDTYLFESHNTFDKSWVYRYYNEDDTSYLYYKNTNEVDACYEMIIRLHELNLL